MVVWGGLTNSWEEKRREEKWKAKEKRKDIPNWIQSSKEHHFADKGLSSLMVFPIVMYGCESWTTNKTECWRIKAFELWCWRRLLRVPWTARKSIQSNLKEFCPGCSLEGLMLKLKLQYFGHLMRRAGSLEKTLMLGNIGCRRRRGQPRMRWLDGITGLNGHEFEQDLGVGDGQGGLVCCSPWGCKESDTTERLNWTDGQTYRVLN